jgi:prolyl-tRNA editing enzyme YbaK/EbsC (Cys-tRNA(Pro) deacylase)
MEMSMETSQAGATGGPAEAGGLSASARRVQQALAERGFDLRVVELPQSTRTSAEAAAAVGAARGAPVAVGQIAKSLVFRGAASDRPVLVIASGANRVDEAAVAARLGEPLAKADAAYVRARTGFVIGGVPPVGHSEPLLTLIDEDLLGYAEIWAAAGTPNAVFRLRPEELAGLTGGEVAKVRLERE